VVLERSFADALGRAGDQVLSTSMMSRPALVALALLAENVTLALGAAGVGLLGGWLTAPLITSPGAGLVGAPGAPSLTAADAGITVGVALVVALASTLVPASGPPGSAQ
jgi:hypothetical protein